MPAPPRAKLHNKTGKIKTIGNNGPTTLISMASSSASTSNNSTRDSDADRQFELELCWCIQQLETSLKTGKLNEKQIQDVNKTLKILKSNNQPVIKKRQLMRTTFGDYRIKMIDEEKKMSMSAKQIKFNTNATPSTKSYFIKKSAFITSGKDFKFNFPIEDLEQLNISDDGNASKNDLPEANYKIENNFQFTPSGNLFKFNFNVQNNEI